MNIEKSQKTVKSYNVVTNLNPIFYPKPSSEVYMAVDFLAAKIPAWKAIQTKLQPKIKYEYPVQPNLSEIKQRKLGPGAYKQITPTSGPKYRFSSVPRFSNSDKLKLLIPNLEKQTLSTLQRGKQLLKKNLDTSPSIQSNRMLRLKYKLETRANSEMIAKTTREMLKHNERQKILEKIQKKELKFQRWTSKRFCIQAEKGWSTLIVCFSIVQNLNDWLKIKRKLKDVFTKNSKIIYQASRVIGRIQIKLKKMRRMKALKTLQLMLLPLFQKKVEKLIFEFKITVTKTLESCLAKKMFKRLFISWRKKYTKVENGLRGLILVFLARKDSLYEYLNTIQHSYHTYSSKMLISPENSKIIIRKYLYKKLQEYHRNKKEYYKNLFFIRNELRKNSTQRIKEIYNRKKGIRLSVDIYLTPVFRIFNREEIIRMYLEEEAKLHIELDKKDSVATLSGSRGFQEMIKKIITASKVPTQNKN